MSDIEQAHNEFWDDLIRDAEVKKDVQAAIFFDIYSGVAAENGDSGDLEYCPVRKEGSHGFQIDGYLLDADQGELVIAISDFRADREIQSLNAAHIDSSYRKAQRFFNNALTNEFVVSLEETGYAFQAAYLINQYASQIRRVKFLLLTNARFASRRKSIETEKVNGRMFAYNLLDFSRYLDIQNSRTGIEPIELDMKELNGDPLPCLKAHTQTGQYASYLIVMPGKLLADIYGAYGARLLEQNVRTFLQARTKVNKGIINTIKQTPEMFFAYNNGLTATASHIDLDFGFQGGLGVRSISDLQIVNGGQTTASILYARDKEECDLEKVFVQVKLSVVHPENVKEIVPKISKFANTQNRISEADFFASHPFHVRLEKISRRLPAPQRENTLVNTKWFYERARGQYRDKQAYLSDAQRRKFQSEYPSDQLIVKTDLAKYEMTFAGNPALVSQGAQKCFLSYADEITKAWDKDDSSINEEYFKQLIAKAIVFRWSDKMIAQSDWYKNDRGYKAQVVTYTISWLVDRIKSKFNSQLDLNLIWRRQDPADEIKTVLQNAAVKIAASIKNAPPEVRNIGEYCKKQFCFENLKKSIEMELPESLKAYLIDKDEATLRKKEAKTVQKIDSDIDIDIKIVELMPHWKSIRDFSMSSDLLTSNGDRAISKLLRGNINLTRSEKIALTELLASMDEIGYEVPA